DALHLEVDALQQRYPDADTPETQRPAIAMEITKKQMEINFLTEEAYIDPAALKMMVNPEAVLSPQQSVDAVLSNVERMEEVIQESGGDVVVASRQYELYKYMSRASRAMQHEQTDMFFDGLNQEIAQVDREGAKLWTPGQLRQHYTDFMKYVEKFVKNNPRIQPPTPPASSGGQTPKPPAPAPKSSTSTSSKQLTWSFDPPKSRFGVPTVETRVATDDDIIVDTNVIRALDMDQRGEKLQSRQQLSVDMMQGQSLIVTPNSVLELSEKGLPQGITRQTKILAQIDQTELKTVLDVLLKNSVGGSKGLQDVLIVRQALFTETASGAPAKFATADDGIIKGLARIAGIPTDKLGRYRNVAEYVRYVLKATGFEIQIGSRRLFVIPIQEVRDLKP
ncbi:MAG: hypothetical protein ABIQ93_13520, partial [Saprospiraceae bacterium]